MPSLRHPLDPDDDIDYDGLRGSGYCSWCGAFVQPPEEWWGDLCEKCGKEAQEALKEAQGTIGGGLLTLL
jgi:hypothetical protein